MLKKCEEESCGKHFHILCAYLNGIYFDVKDQNLENDRLRFYGLNAKCFCSDHMAPEKKGKLIKNVYFRRYAINYDNTSNMTYEEFCIRYSNEKFSSKFLNNLSIYKIIFLG